MSHVDARSEKLREAYGVAQEAAHGCAAVSIHVGSDILEYLRDLTVSEATPNAFDGRIGGENWYGFPVVPDAELGATEIHVKTTRVIA